MRELHKWEKEEAVKETCEALVSILISDEPEPGMENLHEVEVPEFMDSWSTVQCIISCIVMYFLEGYMNIFMVRVVSII